MKKKSELDSTLRGWRETFAHNLSYWMAERFPKSPNRPVSLEAASNSAVSKSSINRWTRPDADDYSYPTLDKIIVLAHALQIDPYDLILDAPSAKRLYQAKDDAQPHQDLKSHPRR